MPEHAQCCTQDFKPGDEIQHTDTRIGWVFRTHPLNVKDAIIVTWQTGENKTAFFNQNKCDVFTKTGNNDPSKASNPL